MLQTIVPFNINTDKLLPIALTADSSLPIFVQQMTDDATAWIAETLKKSNAKYAIGGYGEKRSSYGKSELFTNGKEPRCIHLGIDVFGPAGTQVYNTIDATIHSFANNAVFGDYGPTIILKHNNNNNIFYSLHGHLSIKDFAFWEANFSSGQFIKAGTLLGHFGTYHENLGWTPHLHFQIINNIENYKGDYPGVCTETEKEAYLLNCPNPLQYMGLDGATYLD